MTFAQQASASVQRTVTATAAVTTRPALVTAAAPARRGVTLVTGDSVRVLRDAKGRTIVEGLPAARSGAGAAFQTVTTPAHTYVFPNSARPYVGRFLDPGLFDVTTAAGVGARIPVRLTFTGSNAPSVPGVTITSTAAGGASGYLTAASARRFGAALTAQYLLDARAHFPSRTTLFGVSKISAEGSVPPIVSPQYPMRTLIIKVLDGHGRPLSFGFVTVYNTDNFAKFYQFALVVDGQARLSVPLGHYGLDTEFDRLDAAGHFVGFGVVTRSDYLVSAQNQVLTVDGRSATSRLSIRTPRSAAQQTVELDLSREDSTGNGHAVSSYGLLGPGDVYVAPASSPSSGTLSSSVAWNLTGAPLAGTPYAYFLHFPSRPGIPPSQAYGVATSQLATFKSRFYVDLTQRPGALLTYPLLPGSEFAGGWSVPVPLPSNLISYVNATPGAVWFTSLFGSPDPFDNPFAGTIDDGPRLAPAGTTYSADWGRGPALPNVPVETNGYAASFGFDCPTCRTATQMQVGLILATDSTPGHAWELFGNLDGTPVARLRIFRNGSLISDNSDTGLAVAKVPAAPGTYRILDQVNRGPSLALQSVRTTSDITFVSAAGQGPAMPATWTCSLGSGCKVLPLLDTSITLPTNLAGVVPLGTSSITLTVSHIQGAPAARITSGSIEVRRPGGVWAKLSATALGNGVYRATLRTTRADAQSSFDLRVTGTDATGGRIVQTASAAFAVAAS